MSTTPTVRAFETIVLVSGQKGHPVEHLCQSDRTATLCGKKIEPHLPASSVQVPACEMCRRCQAKSVKVQVQREKELAAWANWHSASTGCVSQGRQLQQQDDVSGDELMRLSPIAVPHVC
jgi:hypothetical protein